MKFELEMFRKHFFITEDNPSETSIDKTILVTGTYMSIDVLKMGIRID
jgi:hypothetical protein